MILFLLNTKKSTRTRTSISTASALKYYICSAGKNIVSRTNSLLLVNEELNVSQVIELDMKVH